MASRVSKFKSVPIKEEPGILDKIMGFFRVAPDTKTPTEPMKAGEPAPSIDSTPAPKVEAPSQGLVPDILQHGAATVLRVGGTGLGTIAGGLVGNVPGAIAGGAGGGAAGEYLAQKIEPGGLDRDANLARVAVSAGLGAVPGSFMVRAGKPLVSAGIGAGLGYAGTAGYKAADGATAQEALDPREWSGTDIVTGPVIGALTGGLFGRGKPSGPSSISPRNVPDVPPPTTPPPSPPPSGPKPITDRSPYSVPEMMSPSEIPAEFQGRAGLRVAMDHLKSHKGPVDARTRAAQAVIAKERMRSPGGQISKEIGPLPKDAPSMVEMEQAHDEANKIISSERVATEKTQAKHVEGENKQTARNLEERRKYLRVVEKDRAKADLEVRKRQLEADKKAANQRALDAAEALKEGREPTTPSVVESRSGVDPTGKKVGVSRRWVEKPKDDGEGGGGGGSAPKPGEPIKPAQQGWTRETAEKTTFSSNDEAMKVALATGGTGTTRLGKGKYTISYPAKSSATPTPKGFPADDLTRKAEDRLKKLGLSEEPKPPTDNIPPPAAPVPTPPKKPRGPKGGPTTVAEALQKARPFNQIGKEEQDAVTDVVKRAIDDGYTGDLEALADQASERLLMLKEGRNTVEQSPSKLLDLIRKGGGINEIDQAEEVSKLKQLLQQTGGRSVARLFGKQGMSLDSALEYIKQEGKFNHINSINDLYAEIEKGIRKGVDPDLISEFDESMKKGWWRTNPVDEAPTGKAAADIVNRRVPGGKLPEGMSERRHAEVLADKGGKGPDVPFQPMQDEVRSLADLADDEKAAWDNYFRLKELAATGAATPEEVKRAGKAAGELKAKVARALDEARKAVKPNEAPTPKPNEAVNVSPDWVKEQLAEIDALKKGGGGTTLSAFGAGQLDDIKRIARENPALLSKLLGTGVGAAVGAEANDEDPLTGALIGGGLGFAGGSAIGRIPNLAGRYDSLKEALDPVISRLPSYQRGALLSDPRSIAWNSIAGPWGSQMMGGIEYFLKGKANQDPHQSEIGKDVIKSAANLPKWLKSLKDMYPEAKQKLFDVEEQGRAGRYINPDNPNAFDKATQAPATYMLTGDMVSKANLNEAGIPEEIAKQITLTNEPRRALTRNIVNFGKAGSGEGGTGDPSTIAQMLLPFKRTAANILESGAERTPGLGSIINKLGHEDYKISGGDQLVQQGLGTGVWFAAYQLGKSLDEDSVKIGKLNSLISNLGGQYSLLASTGFAAGQAARKGKKFGAANWQAIKQNYTGRGLPLPTSAPADDVIRGLEEAGKVFDERNVDVKQLVPSTLQPKFLNAVNESYDWLTKEPARPTRSRVSRFRERRPRE